MASGAGVGAGERGGTSNVLYQDTNWEATFKNKHLTDTTSDEFLASYRTVIYARVATNITKNEHGVVTGATMAGAESIENIQNNTAKEFRAIGVVQNYTWNEQRAVNYIWELGSDIPYLIPDRTYGTIQLGRVLILGNDIVNALYLATLPGATAGADNLSPNDKVQPLNSIKDATTPIDILFVAFPTNGSGETKYSRVFKNCHIESRTEQIQAGQVTLMEDVQLRYEAIVGIQLPTNNDKTVNDGVNAGQTTAQQR